MAAGGRYGLAQSLFQVGGNMGSAAGPLLAAFIVVPRGQQSIVWFSGAALIAMAVLFQVGGWYKQRRGAPQKPAMRRQGRDRRAQPLSRGKVLGVAILVALLFSKSFYGGASASYYTFDLIASSALRSRPRRFTSSPSWSASPPAHRRRPGRRPDRTHPGNVDLDRRAPCRSR